MNEHEADRIAVAINTLRPDWPVKQLRTLCAHPDMVRRPRLDAAIALVAVACDSESKTPYRVLETGPWWHAAAAAAGDNHAAPTRAYPPKLEDACALHGDCADRCRGCAADQATDSQTTRAAEKHAQPTSETSLRVANLRNLIRPCTAVDREDPRP